MEIPILARSNTPPFSIEIDGTFTEGRAKSATGFFRDCSTAQASMRLHKKTTYYHELYKILGGGGEGGWRILGRNDPPK